MAATCTVTATITDPSGASLLGNALVRFRLRNYTGFVPVVSGTSVLCETQIDAYPNPAGAISQILTCNTAISPINTFYTVEFWNQGRIVTSANYYFNANTSLNTASNINPAPAPAGPSSIIFENNSVLNSSQTLLNLTSTQFSITDLGNGQLDLEPLTSGGEGANVCSIPPFSAGTVSLASYSLALRIPASYVMAVGNSLQVGLSFYNIVGPNAVVSTAMVAATPPNPVYGIGGFQYQTNWSYGPVGITWPAGSFTQTTETYLSNPAAITVDANHDYYIIVTLSAACTAGIPYISNNSGAGAAWYSMSGYMLGAPTASTNASAIIGGMGGSGIFGIQQVVVG
jgi:hypothetical protein